MLEIQNALRGKSNRNMLVSKSLLYSILRKALWMEPSLLLLCMLVHSMVAVCMQEDHVYSVQSICTHCLEHTHSKQRYV
jgi:hypothetical protein